MSTEGTPGLHPTEPIDMRPLLARRDEVPAARPDLRADPREWHRRGLLAPNELDALVTARVNSIPTVISARHDADELIDSDEPAYGDFLRETPA